MIPLSVVIITLNEEKNIQRCIESVECVADEIIIVDGGSTDKTVEIAGSFTNVKLIENRFEHFGRQKRFAVEQAKYPYILSIDADEALSGELQQNILTIKRNWKMDGYKLPRITCFYGKWLKQYKWHPELIVRLFDRRKGNWNNASVHEKVEMQHDAVVGVVKGYLLHYSYMVDGRTRDYAKIKAKRLFEEGRRASKWRILFAPPARFIKILIFKRGFMNGFYGLAWSIISAHDCFLTYFYLWTLHRGDEKDPDPVS
jgi:glycosyltransferase involved in cell wall biosynthesis